MLKQILESKDDNSEQSHDQVAQLINESLAQNKEAKPRQLRVVRSLTLLELEDQLGGTKVEPNKVEVLQTCTQKISDNKEYKGTFSNVLLQSKTLQMILLSYFSKPNGTITNGVPTIEGTT